MQRKFVCKLLLSGCTIGRCVFQFHICRFVRSILALFETVVIRDGRILSRNSLGDLMHDFPHGYAETTLIIVLVVSRCCRLLKSSASATGGDTSSGQARLEAIEEEETVRMHLGALKREEVALQVGFARVLKSPLSWGINPPC